MSDEEQTVPYARFSKKVAELTELKNQNNLLEERLKELQTVADGAQSLRTEFDEYKQEISHLQQQFETREALYKNGIMDPDVQELAQWRFQKSGAEDFNAWLSGDAKSDALFAKHLQPTQAPEPVNVSEQPSQDAVQAPEAKAAPVSSAPQQTFPSANKGVSTTPPASGHFDMNTLQQMNLEQKREWMSQQFGYGTSKRNS